MLNTKLVVYSHTDYLEILNIQTDYISKYQNTILLINKNNLNLDSLYSKYKQVLYYDDSNVYAARLLECIEQIDDSYFLLTHDIDILISINENMIDSLTNNMDRLNIDRIDLKYTNNLSSNSYINIDHHLNSNIEMLELPNSQNFLIKQLNINNYAYNVNPSIWKKSSLLQILQKFNYKNYRNIEDIDVQAFCMSYNVFKIHSNKVLKCGYFELTEFYKYLHISHNGRFLSYNPQNLTEYNQSYEDVAKDYMSIVDKYELRKSPKWK
jgi:hypothetical protein